MYLHGDLLADASVGGKVASAPRLNDALRQAWTPAPCDAVERRTHKSQRIRVRLDHLDMVWQE